MKNAFYFASEALFILEIFKYLSLHFGHAENQFDEIGLIGRFLTLQPSKQAVAIHILRSISRSIANQAKKFGQLIEQNMKNIFLEK